MRLLLYNIRYGTGGEHIRLPWQGYLSETTGALDRITEFIRSFDADIVGLLEVDGGSYRSSGANQARHIASVLGHFHFYHGKYSTRGITRRLPLFNKQGNAFLVRDRIHNERLHYFNKGTKRLVIELELEKVNLFLVHLALSFRTRHSQLRELAGIVAGSTKPRIVAGDFNPWRGRHELDRFLAEANLLDAAKVNTPTFPSWRPRRQLDYVLHSPGVRVRSFTAPVTGLSDHLPVICDFDLPEAR